MTHENEYHDALIDMLQIIWGEGYMAPGGSGNIAKMFKGIETRGKRVLDIGCGIGGPVFEVATTLGAEVVGIDLEAPLIERARAAAEAKGLADRCTFRVVEVGPLDFPDNSFDIVMTSGAMTQTKDKAAIFGECFRILRPGGWLTCYDWMKSDASYSDDMRYWFKMEGITYALETRADYDAHFRNCGFVNVATEDASGWYREEARREYELMKGGLYPEMVKRLGQKDADHFVENWRSMVVVCDKGEMRQTYCRGQKPA
ncbi:MAG: methyltransferase domain-containing protein [Gammaproteobacteria bacterium]|nr:methyltransferase domain-containing protein [Gammaproteobacteria bacterium]